MNLNEYLNESKDNTGREKPSKMRKFLYRLGNPFRPTPQLITKAETIKHALQMGFVKFVYYKVSGENRIAYGTLEADFLDEYGQYVRKTDRDSACNGVEAAKKIGYIVYFDLIRGSYRMFTVDRKTEILGRYHNVNDLVKHNPDIKSDVAKYL